MEIGFYLNKIESYLKEIQKRSLGEEKNKNNTFRGIEALTELCAKRFGSVFKSTLLRQATALTTPT